MATRTGKSHLTSLHTRPLICFIGRSVVIKVGMVGDSQIGKTSLMVKYVEGSFDEDYIQTLGMSQCFIVQSNFVDTYIVVFSLGLI